MRRSPTTSPSSATGPMCKTFLLTLLLCAEVTAHRRRHRLPDRLFHLAAAGRGAHHPPAAVRHAAVHELHRQDLHDALDPRPQRLPQPDAGRRRHPRRSRAILFLYNQTVDPDHHGGDLPALRHPADLPVARAHPGNLLQASADLGAGMVTTFRHVVLPLSIPGTIAGALFAFVLALGDFITPQMVGGPSGFTFGRVIWSQFGLAYNWPFGAAMGVVLFVRRAGGDRRRRHGRAAGRGSERAEPRRALRRSWPRHARRRSSS